jgi:hypothetical protein
MVVLCPVTSGVVSGGPDGRGGGGDQSGQLGINT